MGQDELKDRLHELFSGAAAERLPDASGSAAGWTPAERDVAAHASLPTTSDATPEADPLSSTEELYRELYENANLIVQSVASDGRILHVNHAWKKALGYSDEDVRALSLMDIVHPDSKLHCQVLMERVMAGEKIDRVEAAFVAKDGRAVVLEGSTSCIFRNGKPVATRGIFVDVTLRRQTEEALRKFQLGIERSTDAVFITDPQGAIIYANPAFERVYGYSVEEALGKTPRILKSGALPQERYRDFWDALLNKQVIAGEIINKTKEGRLIAIEGSNNPILDTAGNIIGFLGIHRDITERKRGEEALTRRAVQLQAASDVSRAASSILRPDELLPHVADRILEAFDLYYVGIFLVEAAGEHAALRAATGEAGRTMLERGHRLKIGDLSMIGWSIAHRQARVALDVGEDAMRFDNPLLPETRSELALPLISRSQALGAVSIQSRHAAAFSAEDISVLQTMADQVANAIANARLFEQTRRQLANLTIIQQTMSALAATFTREEMIDALLPNIAGAVHADAVSMFMIEGEHMIRAGQYPVSHGESAGLGQVIAPTDEPLTRQVIETRRALTFRTDDPRLPDHARQAFQAAGITANATIPLVGREGVLGTLAVSLRQPGRTFGPEDINLLQTLADQTTVAFEKVLLLEKTRRLAQHRQLINQITGKIRSAVSVDDVLRIATEELQEATHATRALARIEPLNRRLIGEAWRSYLAVQPDDLAVESDVSIPSQGTSYVAAPIVVRGETLGTLILEDADAARPWTDEEKDLLNTVSGEVAQMIENARLLEQTQLRAMRESQLNEIVHRIRSAADIDAILRIAAEELNRTFGTSHANAQLGQSASEAGRGNGHP